DQRFEKGILESIKDKVLKENFSFDLIYKIFPNKKKENLVAKIIVHPEEKIFNFFILIENDGHDICKALIYSGKTTDFYFNDLFFYGHWKNDNEFIIRGKDSEIEIHITIDKCTVEFINISANKDKASIFEMMKAN
ncbi:MAG: hypothetical protein ABI653_03350, partial [Bacteroidota bacterium]